MGFVKKKKKSQYEAKPMPHNNYLIRFKTPYSRITRKHRKRKEEVHAAQVIIPKWIRYFYYLFTMITKHTTRKEHILCVQQLSNWHCVKSVRSFRSFSVPYLAVFSLNAGKYRQENLRIWILFTQCGPREKLECCVINGIC